MGAAPTASSSATPCAAAPTASLYNHGRPTAARSKPRTCRSTFAGGVQAHMHYAATPAPSSRCKPTTPNWSRRRSTGERCWDLRTGAQLFALDGHSRHITSLHFEGPLLVSDGTGGNVVVHDFSGKVRSCPLVAI